MRRRFHRREGPGTLELIEEAAHLLRLSPLPVLGSYFIGSLPFVLGLLYFWAEMSRSATAHEHCATSALRTALLFLWMKTWQAIFARRLKEQITGRPAPAFGFRRFLRVAAIQTVLQPSGLFLLPAALATVAPFGWVYAFFQNVTVFGAEDGADVKQVFRKAARQAQLWPIKNVQALAILSFFGLVVFLDVAVAFVEVPSLLKTFLGIETAFSRSPWSFLNTTFLLTVCGVTYLCLDPLFKAVYTLRCFYGESLRTGEDLKVELRQFVGSRAVGMSLLLFFAVANWANAGAATPEDLSVTRPQSAIQSPKVSPVDLDHAIEQVIQRREFNWRLPREKIGADKSERGVLASFMDSVVKTIRDSARAVVRWIGSVLDWLREKIFGRSKTVHESDRSSLSWMAPLQALIFVLLALVASAVAILFYRGWRQRRRRAETASEPIMPVPDLADENIVASQLPEDEWLRLARELIGRGELRLALRALYLASLAHLAQRDLIRVAKFKSNRDYEQELRRRARARPELQSAFAENVSVFDRVWYGLHEVTHDALQQFQANVERIKAC